MADGTDGRDAPERALWPWVIFALLLAASIALFFAYVPRGGDVAT
jgi:hypothetical protein